MMKNKRVDIIAPNPIHGAFMYPLIGAVVNQDVTEDQIYRCLVGGAEVVEILPNGQRVQLDFKNYNKDNGGKLVIPTPKAQATPAKEQEKVTLSFAKPEEKVVEVAAEEEAVAIESEEVVVEETVEDEAPVAQQQKQNFNRKK